MSQSKNLDPCLGVDGLMCVGACHESVGAAGGGDVWAEIVGTEGVAVTLAHCRRPRAPALAGYLIIVRKRSSIEPQNKNK